jgi:hypothetical protein
MKSFVIDVNGSAIMFPGRVLVIVLPDHVVQGHEHGAKLEGISLPVFASVEHLLSNDRVEIRLSHPETGEPFYMEVDGNCLEWVPR